MIKSISILFFTATLFSCSEKKGNPIMEVSVIQEEPVIIEPPQVVFTDLIPEQFPDSAKTEIIKEITNRIDADTTLIIKEIANSTTTLYAYYRNDSLVKLVEGSQLLFHGSAYYFLINQLICVKESCSSNKVSAMCDPFRATETTFFYNNKLIQQNFYTSRNVYMFCGCNFGTLLNQHPDSSDDSQQVLMSHINELVTKIENGD